ncbi:MAG TPA: hypothetical protein VHA33_28095 [Candidatus Angelobacter sp.]|jgi:hypothetical protein|nr:hypothetical protein [Candidatus Angelobacter sp.]
MDFSFSNESALRKYLLGTLEPQGCDEIEEQLLSNEEFARLIDLIEDEIIEEYVDGSLTPKDQQAVETYFLRPPSRQKKLKFARMLRTQFREETEVESVPARTPLSPHRTWLYWTVAGALAAMFVITASLGIYTTKLRGDLETETARNLKIQEDLKQEQTRLAVLEKEAEKLRNQINTANENPQSSYFTLFPSSILPMSSGNGLPVFPACPGTTLKLEIPLGDIPVQPYHVSLLGPDGKELWSRPSVKPTHDELLFPVQYNKWQKGYYSVILTGTSGNPNSPKVPYHFRVSNSCHP